MAEHYAEIAENLGQHVVDVVTRTLPDVISRNLRH
jgi:hypothetical protein